MKRLFIVFVLALAAGLGAYRIARATNPPAARATAALYACPMHPAYTATQPGNCPICGMQLVRRDRTPSAEISLSVDEQQRAGVAVTQIARQPLSKDIAAPGQVTLDSPTLLNSPVDGQVTSVAVATDGPNSIPVRKDQVLYVIHPASGTNPPGPLEIRAPATSWITLNAPVNSAVHKDQSLAFYLSVENVPVIAEVPLDGIGYVKSGSPAEMTSDTDPGKAWRGSVTNVLGIYDQRTNAVKVKLVFPNDSLNLRANMPVHVIVHYRGPSVLAIPQDAVLWTGKHWVCYISTSPGHFAARPIEIGAHFDGFYQVRSGLVAGDRVVSKAAFLLDSEARLNPEIAR